MLLILAVTGLVLSVQLALLCPEVSYALNSGEEEAIIAFSSDVHNLGNNTSAKRLGKWIDSIKDIYGFIDIMAFGGDLAIGKSTADANQYWKNAQKCMDVLDEKTVRAVYTTGNHEYSPGKFTASKNKTTKRYTINAEAAAEERYRIYCLGSESKEYKYSDSQIKKLEKYFNAVGNDRPIFIITHYPLHSFKSRQTGNSAKLINAINKAAINNTPKDTSDDKTVVFIWGHNHTLSDVYYDGIYKPGERIPYDMAGNSKSLKFYYASAGCMSDSEYTSGSASVKGKGLVVKVGSDNSLNFNYYDEKGKVVTLKNPRRVKPTKAILVAKGIASGKRAVTISWNKVTGADRYLIYMGKCNTGKKKYKYKRVKTVKSGTLRWKRTNLARSTYYKFYVVAQRKSGGKYKTIATSRDGHFISGNSRGSYTNPKSLKLNKNKISLKKGKSATIKGKVNKVNGRKRIQTSHARLLRFRSNNPSVASVNSKGKITAKGVGGCNIYVQTVNGIWQVCRVTVN